MRDSDLHDPDLAGRAQRAATELERASGRWQAKHGLASQQMPTVSSYVGYSPEQPGGHPCVVFRIDARQAEQLAALLERHEPVGPAHASLASMPGAPSRQDPATWQEARSQPVPHEPATEPATPQPLRRAETPGRHASRGPAVAAAGTAQGTGARGYPPQAYGAAVQALAEPQDYTDPRGYPLQRHGRLHAIASEPDSDFRVRRAQSARAATHYSQPQDRATSLREAAEKDAAAIRQRAAQQAAWLTREASQEAARIREAAEKEAAQLRAALAAMSGEMGRVAAYVTEGLTDPSIPVIRPAATPATRPARLSALRPLPPAPDARPARAPATRPERRRPSRPGRPAVIPDDRRIKPAKRTRQENAFRVSKFALATGLLAVVAAAGTEFALHGPAFFVFRQGGAGETPGTFTDQQFLARQNAQEHPKPTKPTVVKPATKNAKPTPAAHN